MFYGGSSIGSVGYGSLSGGVTVAANLTLPVMTVSAIALNHADSSLTLPQFATDFAGHLEVNASLTFPIITLNALAHLPADGDVALPLLSLSAFSSPGIADITLPLLSVVSTSGLATSATATITLPLLVVVSTANGTIIGSITLPLISLSARAYKGSPPECVVMNTKLSAISEYKDYAFNSYARFNGVDLAANQNGIYSRDTSSTDNAGVDDYKIKAHIRTGRIDVYDGMVQRLRNAYLSHESDGDLQFVTKADDTISRKYALVKQQDSAGIIERRIKFERGIRNRVFDFKVENIDGSSMEVDSFNIMLEPILGKKG